MGEQEETPGAEIKVRRTRRRVYEQETSGAAGRETGEEIAIPPEQVVMAPGRKGLQAEAIVRRHMAWSAAAGLVPVPFLDMMAVVALQLKMLKNLCGLYGMDYSEQRAKSAVTSLIGGVHAGLIAGSLIKLVPFVGVASLAAIPVASGGITYAVGRVFIRHFESGGALLDFDPAKVRSFFSEQYREGRGRASGGGGKE